LELISKVQYKTCEKGEFHDIAARSFEQTRALLFDFPWDDERHMTSVELTCPSISVEHPEGTYLKVGPYFSGKFVLYYLNSRKKVYFKAVNTLDEAADAIEQFFKQYGILGEYAKYGFVVNPSKHFITNTFEYTVDRQATRTFFRAPVFTATVCLIMWVGMFFGSNGGWNLGFPIAMLLIIFTMFAPHTYLYFNYRWSDEDQYLQISKGCDHFSFGTLNTPRVYKKHDVDRIIIFGNQNRRNPWESAKVFQVIFKNGEQIQFTSLLISASKLRMKFEEHPFEEVDKFFPAL
jgi:hypothetical protein